MSRYTHWGCEHATAAAASTTGTQPQRITTSWQWRATRITKGGPHIALDKVFQKQGLFHHESHTKLTREPRGTVGHMLHSGERFPKNVCSCISNFKSNRSCTLGSAGLENRASLSPCLQDGPAAMKKNVKNSRLNVSRTERLDERQHETPCFVIQSLA